jgi:ABC-type uncharacterized transport system permease subunit
LSYRINKELLIYSINKLDEVFKTQIVLLSKDISFDLAFDFPIVMLVIGQVYDLNIYNSKIERMVKQFVPYFETIMPSLNINRLYLAFALNKLLSRIPNVWLKRQVKILLYATDFILLQNEVDENIYNLRYGVYGLKYILWQLFESLSEEDNISLCVVELYNKLPVFTGKLSLGDIQVASKSLGITEGITGIGLYDLLLPSTLPILLNKTKLK